MSNRPLALLGLMMVFSCWITPVQAAESDLLGRYWLPSHDGQFEVYLKEGRYFGRIISYRVPGQLDEANSDPALTNRPFIGIDMFASFRFDVESTRWVDGSIYDPENGKTYDCFLWFEPDDPSVLMARGFIGISLFGRNEQFDRVVTRTATEKESDS